MTEEQKTLAQINKEDKSPDSPAVIAYRLGQVENAVKAGFEAHNTKLDNLLNNFATKTEVAEVKSRADEKHTAMEAVAKAKNEEQDRAIRKLDDWNLWAARIVLGTVLLAILGLVIVKANNLL